MKCLIVFSLVAIAISAAYSVRPEVIDAEEVSKQANANKEQWDELEKSFTKLISGIQTAITKVENLQKTLNESFPEVSLTPGANKNSEVNDLNA